MAAVCSITSTGSGGAGSGKTLVGLEFLVLGATQFDEPGVFISFEETLPDLALKNTLERTDGKAPDGGRAPRLFVWKGVRPKRCRLIS